MLRMAEMCRSRNQIFRTYTKHNKAVHNTLITTFGVKHNAYWNNIQSEVTLEDLFK